MTSTLDLTCLHTNQRLLVEELMRRGANVTPLDYNLELMQVSYKGTSEYLLDRASKIVSYLPSSLAADKHTAKLLLEERGLYVPEGRIFGGGEIEAALNYGDEIGFPLVVKPNTGSHGELVRSGLQNREQLKEAICALIHQAGEQSFFIIERHIHGSEYRIFITTKGDYAVLLRDPAHVIGDGKNNIRALADQESLRREAVKKKEGSALCPIALDDIVLNFLHQKGLSLEHIPNKGEKIYLRLSSNLAQGGVSKDMTDVIHPSVLDIANRALQTFDGLPCIGIDFLTPDITADQATVTHAIIEINANPGLAMHHMPAIGLPRDVAAYMADVMFPEL